MIGSEQGTPARKTGTVAEMAEGVLARQAEASSSQSGEPFDAALEDVRDTEAGRRLGALADGRHGEEDAERWQEDLARRRAQERRREQVEEKKRTEKAAAWERFKREEALELELRKQGQLSRMLGKPQAGELPAALSLLASQDEQQAREGLVALMRNGKVSYERLEDLTEEDMPARIAANRLRTSWLKERLDGWLATGERSDR